MSQAYSVHLMYFISLRNKNQLLVPFNKNKPTSRWLFHSQIHISIDPYASRSQMVTFLTNTTTAEYWFRETSFQLKFQLQEGTERLGGASVGC